MPTEPNLPWDKGILVIESGPQGLPGPPGQVDAASVASAVQAWLNANGVAVEWGQITGDITAQADLQQTLSTLDGGTF
jgi:hypothetical protein